MSITRLSGGLTPADGADPRTFPTIWNATADSVEATEGTVASQGSAIVALEADVEDLQDGVIGGTAVYRFVETVYFTSNGTFTKADYPWLRAIRVKCQGAGGGGGSCSTTTAGQNSVGGSGAGGGYAESFITDIAGLPASVTVTRGSGGNGGATANTNGGTGGNSSFGSLVIGNGGGFGAGDDSGTVPRLRSGDAGGAGGTGDVVFTGGTGAFRFMIQGVISPVVSGGGSFLAQSFGSTIAFVTGLDGSTVPAGAYGVGGIGGSNPENNATFRSGSAGGNGIVIVELYA
jgi:hypothetical protein